MGHVRAHWRRTGLFRRHVVRSHYRSNPRHNNMIVIIGVAVISILVIAVLAAIF
jgi:hypothetical protein